MAVLIRCIYFFNYLIWKNIFILIFLWNHLLLNRHISQIPHYISQVSCNAPFCKRYVYILFESVALGEMAEVQCGRLVYCLPVLLALISQPVNWSLHYRFYLCIIYTLMWIRLLDCMSHTNHWDRFPLNTWMLQVEMSPDWAVKSCVSVTNGVPDHIDKGRT